jgi:type I restriction enzyme M protein
VSDLNISNFIWNIADDVLRDVYVRGKYRDVILPMTVIRRLDAVLEPTKDAMAMKEQLDKAGVANQHAALCQASGEATTRRSFDFAILRRAPAANSLKSDFESYLDGFSSDVQEVLEKFKFRNQIGPANIEDDKARQPILALSRCATAPHSRPARIKIRLMCGLWY